jgi:hypothetical protein
MMEVWQSSFPSAGGFAAEAIAGEKTIRRSLLLGGGHRREMPSNRCASV